MKRRQKVENDPWEFFSHIRTFDRDGHILPFPRYEYLEEMVYDLNNVRLNIWEKSRQMLATWTVAGQMVYLMRFNPLIENLFISKNQEYSIDFGSRLKFINQHLPDFLQIPEGSDKSTKYGVLHPDPTKEGEYVEAVSKFLPSSKNAGRGSQAKFTALDEFAFQQWARKTWTAVQPSIDKTGRMVVLSTHDGVSTKFNELVKNSEKLGFKKRTIHYSQNPQKDDEWYDKTRAGYTKEEWDQEFECKVTRPSGLVYQEFNDNYVVNSVDILKGGRFYLSLDFGYTNPFCGLLFYSPPPDFDTFIVIDEFYKPNMLIPDIVPYLEDMLNVQFYDPESDERKIGRAKLTFTVADREDKRGRVELSQAGFPSKPSKGSVRDGIKKVKFWLQNGKLYVHRRCSNTLFEFDNYSEKEFQEGKNQDENPIKEHDHAMDCIKNLAYILQAGHAKIHRRKPAGF